MTLIDTLMSGIGPSLLLISIGGTLVGAVLMAVDFLRRPRLERKGGFA